MRGTGGRGGHAALLPVRPRASSQSRNGAPKAPVTTPTGRLRSAKRVRPDVVADEHDQRADQPGRGQRRTSAVEGTRDRSGQEGDERDGAGGRDADGDQEDAEQHAGRRCVARPTPRPAAASSPSSVARQRPRRPRGGGQQHGQRERQQTDGGPRDAVDAAGQPAQHQLDVVLVDAREDVLDDRLHRRGEADPSQHEPEARVVAGHQAHGERDAQRTERWRRPPPTSRSTRRA